jgi:hypothetical protein
MMRGVALGAFLSAAVATVGCSHVGSSGAGMNTVNGEIWYVRTTWFLGIPVGESVWYCAPPIGRGGAPCKRAQVIDADDPKWQQLHEAPPGMGAQTIYTGDAPEPRKEKQPKKKREEDANETNGAEGNQPEENADDAAE